MNHKHLEKTIAILFCTWIILFLCTEILLNLTPPISRDALIHHLAVPKLWLNHGGIYEIPWANYSYYPMNINLLYVICLYLKNDIAPKFVHLGFGLATGWLIYLYLKQKFDSNWGLMGMLIFITTPIVVWLSTSAYIDLGMTFFTTVSVMAFIKFRDSEYKAFKWLFISSLSMGIAIGSKYNALIAWFIMNIFLMLSVVRDTQKQKVALQYGILFFIVTTFVASPWYFKNFFQTGNPFYPLFDSLIDSFYHHSVQGTLKQGVIQKNSQISFFKMREVMYNESFWETLLIPIRMFFQGKDNSYQYFQGSLNPVLIVFSPFVILNKRYAKDKFVFLFFAVIFIFMAYFLTAKQVRYVLPALPFLAIIAVMGIKDIMDKLKDETFLSSSQLGKNAKLITRILLFAVVAILLTLNLVYLKGRINIIKPFPYVIGKESREAFLKRHLLHYDAVKYIDNNLPKDAKIFTMFLGRRGYYLNRAYKNEPSFGMNTIGQMVNNAEREEKFVRYVLSMGVTHILMRTDLVNKYLKDNFSKDNIHRFLTLKNKYWKKVYENNNYIIWDIRIKG